MAFFLPSIGILLSGSDQLLNEYATQCLKNTVTEADIPQVTNVCDWAGVSCENGVVRKIRWSEGKMGVKSFDWLPPDTQKILFQGQVKPKRLLTRNLPRYLTFCVIVESELYGEVDLRTLPERLNALSLMNNHIKGEVYLTSLPRNITLIEINENRISRIFVDSSRLPESLLDVRCTRKGSRVKIVELSKSRIVDERITSDDDLLHLYWECAYKDW